MEISFETKQLRRICEEEEAAIEILGTKTAFSLKKRLADIHAALNANDLIAGNPKEIFFQESSSLKINLGNGYSLVVASNHVTTNVKRGWSTVTRIKVKTVGKINE